MVKHIVLFRFRADVEPEVRREAAEIFKARILALPQKLDFIRQLEVGFNINPDEQWDIALVSAFDNLEDVRRYSLFPDHQSAAGELKKYIDGRSCVDFEV